MLTRYQDGFGLIRPQRDGSGLLVSNGVVNLVEPAVHIPDNGMAEVFNGTLRPDSGIDLYASHANWWFQEGVQGSTAEHGALASYYRTNSISTVKLLQQVGTNQLRLNRTNYLAFGNTSYSGTLLKNHDTPVERNRHFFSDFDYAKEVLMTPGTVTNGTYKGVAAFLFL